MTDRIALAEAFLQEAVYRSRARQSVPAALRAPARTDAGQCGLGEKAAVVLDLDERGRELLAALWPAPLGADVVEAIRARLAAWVRRQDAFDRERNHFLKAFRHEHGFDRNAYGDDVREAYERGLAEVNAEVDVARRTAAEELLAL